VLVGRARHGIDGPGWFFDDAAPDPGAVEGEVESTVYIPLGDDHGYVERRLVRTGATGGRSRWSLDRHD
ncbi:MAG: hypothetical protein QOC79_908, partial [Actinomycetota bacterium]|nr:hypothetical protein [Actinomycetota bacterium]